jgi:hypothetical protein
MRDHILSKDAVKEGVDLTSVQLIALLDVFGQSLIACGIGEHSAKHLVDHGDYLRTKLIEAIKAELNNPYDTPREDEDPASTAQLIGLQSLFCQALAACEVNKDMARQLLDPTDHFHTRLTSAIIQCLDQRRITPQTWLRFPVNLDEDLESILQQCKFSWRAVIGERYADRLVPPAEEYTLATCSTILTDRGRANRLRGEGYRPGTMRELACMYHAFPTIMDECHAIYAFGTELVRNRYAVIKREIASSSRTGVVLKATVDEQYLFMEPGTYHMLLARL